MSGGGGGGIVVFKAGSSKQQVDSGLAISLCAHVRNWKSILDEQKFYAFDMVQVDQGQQFEFKAILLFRFNGISSERFHIEK